jgi:hypothetical protein
MMAQKLTQKRALLPKRSRGEIGLLEIAEPIGHCVQLGDCLNLNFNHSNIEISVGE